MTTNQQAQRDSASALFKDGKGVLAVDESNGTCNKRFAALGISQTNAAQHALLDQARRNQAARQGSNTAAIA